ALPSPPARPSPRKSRTCCANARHCTKPPPITRSTPTPPTPARSRTPSSACIAPEAIRRPRAAGSVVRHGSVHVLSGAVHVLVHGLSTATARRVIGSCDQVWAPEDVYEYEYEYGYRAGTGISLACVQPERV